MYQAITIPDANLLPFEQAKAQIAQLTVQCKNYIIHSKETLDGAIELAKGAKKIEQLIDNKRREIKQPYLDQGKAIDSIAKNLTDELTGAIQDLRNQIKNYQAEQERLRLVELKWLEEERCRKEEELRKAAENNEQISYADSQEILELQKKEKEIVSAPPPNNIRKIWTFSIIDPNIIPTLYLSPDEKKIKAAIAAGIREIPGIKIYQRDDLYLR